MKSLRLLKVNLEDFLILFKVGFVIVKSKNFFVQYYRIVGIELLYYGDFQLVFDGLNYSAFYIYF